MSLSTFSACGLSDMLLAESQNFEFLDIFAEGGAGTHAKLTGEAKVLIMHSFESAGKLDYLVIPGPEIVYSPSLAQSWPSFASGIAPDVQWPEKLWEIDVEEKVWSSGVIMNGLDAIAAYMYIRKKVAPEFAEAVCNIADFGEPADTGKLLIAHCAVLKCENNDNDNDNDEEHMPLSDQSTPSLTPSPSRSLSPIPPVQPDYFYSPDGDAHPFPASPLSSGRTWLSPDDDPLATKGIPVFKPTMDEFVDFEAYMTRVECWGMRSGIVKIVPPKEWSDSLPSIGAQLASIRIKSPIEQHMLGRSGLYRQQNIEKRKAISVREWAELCAKEDFRAPAVDEVGLKAAGGNLLDKRRRSKRRSDTAKGVLDENVVVKEEADEEPSLEDTPIPMHTPEADVDVGVGEAADNFNDRDEEELTTKATRKRRTHTRADREAALAKRAILDSAFMETFDPKTSWLPRDTTAEDYTPAFCSTLERRFWRNCGLSRPPWYGADTAGSLFTDVTTSWNVSALPSTLTRLLPASLNGLPGVNTPYLYFGMWRATFAWHVEDMDLFSINYIHFGAPKFWYSIPQARAVQFENTLRSYFPRDVAQCRQFLRHKSFLASPTLLAQSSCKPNTLVQQAGEFVVTYPRGYHAGFNLGFNCAESVNFALDSWLELGRKAQACGCIGDSVRIDVDALLLQREAEVQEALRLEKEDVELNTKPKSSRKRKSDGTSLPKSKKAKVKIEPTDGHSSIKQKIMLKVPKDLGPFPCCLCVSRERASLLPVHDPPRTRAGCQNYIPKDTAGIDVWQAHETCASIVPETWVDEVVDETGKVEKVVFGVDAIVKDRWMLKCSTCQKGRAKAHGAPIQCTKGKCPKAFHVSCARDGGEEARVFFAELREVEKEVVLNDVTPLAGSSIDANVVDMTSVVGEPTSIDPALLTASPSDISLTTAITPLVKLQNTPQPNIIKSVKKIEYELLCTQHNPVVAAAKRANKLDRVRNDLIALPPMSRIKLRVSAGVFEVSLIAVNEERNAVEVIWDDGIKREFKWSSVVWGKTEGQPVGQKPTVAAPAHNLEVHPKYAHMQVSGYASSSTPTPDSQAAGQPAFRSSSSGTMSGSATQAYSYNAACGQFQYGSGTYSYYSHPSAQPVPGGSMQPYASLSQPQYGTVAPAPYSVQSHYPYYSPSPGTLPYMPPHIPPTYSMFSVTNAKPRTSPFSQAFQQTLASSVASLPPRTGLLGTATSHPPQQQLPQAGEVVMHKWSPPQTATTASSNTPSVTPPATAASLKTVAAPIDTDSVPTQQQEGVASASSNSNSMSPDVLQAVEELQALSALEPSQLQEVLNTRPALREAVKTLLAHQAMQHPLQFT
ncbi:hypothetical protein EW145_g4167 [Phellinidium pouzarii]|uniref:[histone H3]-trimethyl-L-lysine(9) demethylase n=1 Tax=Phellinidium pouzarii TaxID=167371 RepID=A0A4S4L4P8_9AGAM|nr:hypothetical protein EW145_g4167 [Phellinidium pouzarii]